MNETRFVSAEGEFHLCLSNMRDLLDNAVERLEYLYDRHYEKVADKKERLLARNLTEYEAAAEAEEIAEKLLEEFETMIEIKG